MLLLDHAPHRLATAGRWASWCASWRRSTTPSRAGRPSPLPELPVQYADFAVWQRELAAGRGAGARSSPTGASGSPARRRPLELPTDRPRPRGADLPRRERAASLLPAGLAAAACASSAAREGATLFMILLAALPARCSPASPARTTSLVGSPVAGRDRARDRRADRLLRQHPGAAHRPLRATPRFRELLARVREVDARRLRAPGRAVREAARGAAARARPRRARRSSRCCSTCSTCPTRRIGLPGLDARARSAPPEPTSKFDLTLYVARGRRGGLRFDLVYNADLFDARADGRAAARSSTHLLAQAVARPRRAPVGALLAGDRRRPRRLLPDPAAAAGRRAGAGAVHELFAAQAAARARPAGGRGRATGRRWTYGELDARANRLAALPAGRAASARATWWPSGRTAARRWSGRCSAR